MWAHTHIHIHAHAHTPSSPGEESGGLGNPHGIHRPTVIRLLAQAAQPQHRHLGFTWYANTFS